MPEAPVYLDYNATTPCDPRVVEAMLPYFTTNFGNAASRSHSYGWSAEEAVKLSREQVAALIGADPSEIIFTSGATEGVNLAIKGVYEMYAGKGNHIITAATEHKAVIDTCRYLEKIGGEVTWLQVDRTGNIDVEELEAAIRPTTVLISLMAANNETGLINPIKKFSEVARKHGVLFFTDATQAAGKIPVNVNDDGIDVLTFSAHKIYGPKGVGAVYVRRRNPRVKLAARIHGGGHERMMRSGTLNVPGIVGFGKACEIAAAEMHAHAERLEELRDRFESELLSLGHVHINGDASSRLPHVANLSFEGVDGEALLLSINKKIAVSSGSACTSASMEPSYVLKAMGVTDDLAYSSLRFSLGKFTTEEEILFASSKLSEAIMKLREEYAALRS